MLRLTVRLWLAIMVTGFASLPAVGQTAAPAIKLDAAERAALVTLQKAVNAKDFAAFDAALPNARASVSSPDGRYALGTLMYNYGNAKPDRKILLQGLELIIASGSPSFLQEARPRILAAASGLAYEFGDNLKAVDYGGRALALRPNDTNTMVTMAEALVKLSDVAGGVAYIERAISASRSLAEKPPETWYRRALSLAHRIRDKSAIKRLGEVWLADYPTDKNRKDVDEVFAYYGVTGAGRPAQPPPISASAASTVPASQIGAAPAQAALQQRPPNDALPSVLMASKPVLAAASGPRYALVIGNGRYVGNLNPLANPVNDAGVIAAALRASGFDVDLQIDLDQRGMKAAIARLGKRMRDGGTAVTGLFYFAGHGMQFRGINYLVPVDAQIESEADADLVAVAADSVMSQMEVAKAVTNIIVLDACRNTPVFSQFRSASRGLARMDAPNGSFISYSTAPGAVAEDGEGANSPFAAALARQMATPGQPIEILFRNVRKEVLANTAGRQTPWDASSLVDTFVFKEAH